MDKIIVLCGESVSLKNLIENSIPSADSSLSFLVRYLGRCHGSAHIEKEGASNKQTINDTRLSGPFGFESSPLKDLTKSLISLPYHQLKTGPNS
jgi:hypothetical protein